MSKKLVFGIDLGINNVGWAAIRKTDGAVEILAIGTYAFDSPLSNEEKPGEGLKSKVRGNLRRARRTTRRRHQRKMRLYRLLAEHGFLPKTMRERVELFCRNKDAQTGLPCDPYSLRAEALNRPLEPYELGRALCHLNQRRGFLSPRDLMAQGAFTSSAVNEFYTDDEEAIGLIAEIQRTATEMREFPTIGAFLSDRHQKGEPVRKKQLKVKDDRRFVRADRKMIEDEFWKIIRIQRQHHPVLTESLVQSIHGIIFSQRLLATDASTRGRCQFFPKELRIPRASLTAQKFIIAQEVAHLLIVEGVPEPRALEPEERAKLVAELMKGRSLRWRDIRELLNLGEGVRFNVEADSRRESLTGSKTVEVLRSIVGDKWEQLGEQGQRELVGDIISIRDWTRDIKYRVKPAAHRRRELILRKAYGSGAARFSEGESNELATSPLPDGYLNLSLRAIKKIMPHLLRDKVYSEACSSCGIDHSNSMTEPQVLDRLPFPSDNDIPNAVVRCTVRGAVRVLNALHAEFGKPDEIHIELPRDLAMGAQAREKLAKTQSANERERQEIARELIRIKYPPSRTNIRKVQLWRELGGAALPYEPDVTIPDLRSLMEGDFEIDHIVPRSHALDSSMANLTLCTRDFNTRVKKHNTLWEAVGQQDRDRWNRIRAHIRGIRSMPRHKRDRILAKERPIDFTGRHLAATGYISRKVLALAQRMVTKKHNAIVMPGRATAEFRKFWELDYLVELHPEEDAERARWKEFMKKLEGGLAKEDDIPKSSFVAKPRSNFKHHALDALVVALADRSSLKAMTDYWQLKELGDPRYHSREMRKVEKIRTLPDPELKAKASKALEAAVIVHRPNRKPSGQLHLQQPVEGFVLSVPQGKPWSSMLIGKHLVKFDQDGKAAQAYPLGNNHHVVIWESVEPNAKGIPTRRAEVVSTFEAQRRRQHGEPVVRTHSGISGWKFVMALCKGDMVEMADGTLALVSKFSAKAREGDAEIALWRPHAARQLGKINAQNPYVVAYIQTAGRLHEIAARVVLDPLGRVVFRENGAL